MFVIRARFLAGSLLLASVLFWFGCPTPPKQTPRVTVLEPELVSPAPAPQPAAPVVVVPAETPPPPVREQTASVLPAEKLNFPAGVLPLHLWAQLCGFGETRVLNATFPRSIELRSGEDSLVLTVGQRYAKWNGLQVGLGFSPSVISGELALHSLDVRKNVYPLALGALPALRKERVLVIDPGHGGSDPGTRGSERGAIEKDLTLDWALRVEQLLANSNWRVVLTRRQDVDLPRLDRVAIADSAKADLFISLHFNSLELAGAARGESGIETYCLTPTGLPSTVNRDFVDDARMTYPNNQFDSENLLLAMRLHASLIKATARRDRGVRRARFMTVIREQKRPAVLIEGGFLSTPSEASLILQPQYRQQMAQAIVHALPE